MIKKADTPIFAQMQLQGRKVLTAIERVDVEGISQPLFVRAMTAQGKSDFELAMILHCPDGEIRRNPAGFRACLLRATVFDGKGNAVFAEVSNEELLGLPSQMLEPLVDVAMRLGGFTKADQEELEKK